MFFSSNKWCGAALLFAFPLVARGQRLSLPEVAFQAVPRVPGGFQAKGKVPLTAGGRALTARAIAARDPGNMKVHGWLGPSQWFAPITSRYLAGWKSPAPTTHFQ